MSIDQANEKLEPAVLRHLKNGSSKYQKMSRLHPDMNLFLRDSQPNIHQLWSSGM
ncbi:hypothetical protein L798_14435 [Zootermopsis nevadensis]|uniref:Uncharacterized protein n=1 Tax=Zootermopsis nevadensis TaxID=136037 RepID=A0A067QQR4_ZOONE|nr:hypothetical protein L798_14435 [Zootermopsis nevadensis]